jgi:hypothetical protein
MRNCEEIMKKESNPLPPKDAVKPEPPPAPPNPNSLPEAVAHDSLLADGWNRIEDIRPEYDKLVVVAFENIHKEISYGVGKLQKITQHSGKNSPLLDMWFSHPGWGHKINNPIAWMAIPAFI